MKIFAAFLLLTGIVFIGFGAFIVYKNKYHLINDFETEKKAGRNDDTYAQKVGKAAFILGIAFTILPILLLFSYE